MKNDEIKNNNSQAAILTKFSAAFDGKATVKAQTDASASVADADRNYSSPSQIPMPKVAFKRNKEAEEFQFDKSLAK